MPRTSHGQTRAVAAAAVAGDVLQALDGQDVEAALRCERVSKRDDKPAQRARRAHQVALDLVLRHLVTQHSQLLLGQLARALVLDFLATPGRELRARRGQYRAAAAHAPSPPGWPSPWWARCRRCTCGRAREPLRAQRHGANACARQRRLQPLLVGDLHASHTRSANGQLAAAHSADRAGGAQRLEAHSRATFRVRLRGRACSAAAARCAPRRRVPPHAGAHLRRGRERRRCAQANEGRRRRLRKRGGIGSRISASDAALAAARSRRHACSAGEAAGAGRRARRQGSEAGCPDTESRRRARTATEPRRATGRSAPRRHSCCAIATPVEGAEDVAEQPRGAENGAGTAWSYDAATRAATCLFNARCARRAMVRLAAPCSPGGGASAVPLGGTLGLAPRLCVACFAQPAACAAGAPAGAARGATQRARPPRRACRLAWPPVAALASGSRVAPGMAAPPPRRLRFAPPGAAPPPCTVAAAADASAACRAPFSLACSRRRGRARRPRPCPPP